MDEKGFKKFLKRRGRDPETVRVYVESVKGFERWLFKHWEKRLEEASKSDLRACKKLTRNPLYPYGVRAYYRYLGNKDEIVETINSEILPKLSKSKPIQHLLSWDRFRDILKKVEENGISEEKLVLLNLLWSEMESAHILALRKSDIDFEKRLITSRTKGKTCRVTPEAWKALQKYAPIEDRNQKEKLFTIDSVRTVQKITRDFFEDVGQTPNKLRKSYKADLVEAGKTVRLDYGPDKKPSSRVAKGPKKKLRIMKNLFDKLYQEIINFGSRVHNQITKIKEEEELQRLLEGYLLATFPDEVITHEFEFRGYDNHSKIDITVGKDPKIPIEVKLAKKKMKPYLRKGIGQVTEFLRYSESKKGILVIGDQKRDPESRKLTGIQDSVYIIVI